MMLPGTQFSRSSSIVASLPQLNYLVVRNYTIPFRCYSCPNFVSYSFDVRAETLCCNQGPSLRSPRPFSTGCNNVRRSALLLLLLPPSSSTTLRSPRQASSDVVVAPPGVEVIEGKSRKAGGKSDTLTAGDSGDWRLLADGKQGLGSSS